VRLRDSTCFDLRVSSVAVCVQDARFNQCLAELDSITAVRNQLAEEIKRLDTEKHSIKAVSVKEVTTVKDTLSNTHSQLTSTQTELTQAQQELAQAKEAHEQLKRKSVDLKQAHDSLHREWQIANEQLVGAQKEKSDVCELLRTSQEQMIAHEEAIAQHTSTINDHVAKNSELWAQVEALTNELSIAKQTDTTRTAECVALRASIQTSKQTSTAIQQQYSTLKQELEETKKQLKNEIQQSTERKNKVREYITTIAAEKQELENKIVSLESQLRESVSAKTMQDHQLQLLEMRMATAQEQVSGCGGMYMWFVELITSVVGIAGSGNVATGARDAAEPTAH
jgi:chromosome segregation ATPase